MQEYRTVFEKMIMEETLAQLMQGTEAAELICPQPAVLTNASHVRPRGGIHASDVILDEFFWFMLHTRGFHGKQMPSKEL
jgi:hypothetical protein